MRKALPKITPEQLSGFDKAVQASNALAMYNLGSLFEEGQGVTKDLAKAREWYQKAVDSGYDGAKQALARLDSVQQP